MAAVLVAVALAWLQRGGHLAFDTAPSPRPESAGTAAEDGKGFEYYVLSLSWSPQHCATDGRNDPQQCGSGRSYEFIVHGLWPQYERGSPANCAGDSRVSEPTVAAMRAVMPSDRLIRHQWAKHGVCSGLDESAYFGQVREARAAIAIPDTFRSGSVKVRTSAAAIRGEFLEANGDLRGDMIALRCDGQYLAEVRVCLDRSLKGRPCGSDVRSNCRADPVIVRPVR
ncbi:MAG: ribonuclease T2 [Gammaproteobacteria bacterium]|nr:ribonuclease T2 [Gammaproteobacteria bacterium]